MSPRIALYLLHVLLPVAGIASLLVVAQLTWQALLFGPGVVCLLAGATAVYSADRLFERHAELGRLLVRWLLTISCVATLIAMVQILRYPSQLLSVALPLAAMAAAYPVLSRIPAIKEITVALCWTLGIVGMGFVDEQVRWGLLLEPLSWAILALVLAGTLLCDCKDIEVDRERGVASAPVLIGNPWTRLIAAAAALDAIWLAWWGQGFTLLLASFLLVVLATRKDLLERPLWGPICVDAALCIPGPVAWAGHLLG